MVWNMKKLRLEGEKFANREEELLYNMNIPICFLLLIAILTIIIVFRLFT